MVSLNAVPIVGRDFAFKAAQAVQGTAEFRNVDFRNALRFLDVLTRKGRLLNVTDRDNVVRQIAAHICRCGTYPPLVVFAQYSLALTNVVTFVTSSNMEFFKVTEVIRRLLRVLAKARTEDISLYDSGDVSGFSLFVRREFKREIKWVGAYGYPCTTALRLERGKHPLEYC